MLQLYSLAWVCVCFVTYCVEDYHGEKEWRHYVVERKMQLQLQQDLAVQVPN
jgi:hypothetical protein